MTEGQEKGEGEYKPKTTAPQVEKPKQWAKGVIRGKITTTEKLEFDTRSPDLPHRGG